MADLKNQTDEEKAKEAEAKAKETAAKPASTDDEASSTPEAPYPSQADLDRIREGTFHKRSRELKAEGGSRYKNRESKAD
ncbi:hypothetical protein QBK99_11055 [Corticibacterium sp. UT-5YL-CI-8]|nr:hypothetical protein [Tianweitania sp. UT-5YL-CI-8]